MVEVNPWELKTHLGTMVTLTQQDKAKRQLGIATQGKAFLAASKAQVEVVAVLHLGEVAVDLVEVHQVVAVAHHLVAGNY